MTKYILTGGAVRDLITPLSGTFQGKLNMADDRSRFIGIGIAFGPFHCGWTWFAAEKGGGKRFAAWSQFFHAEQF